MSKRQIINFDELKFEPFDNYGKIIPGMSWHKISYRKDNGGQGTYVLKMEPGAKSLPHEHTGFEEFLMLRGDLLTQMEKFLKWVILFLLSQDQLIPLIVKMVA